MGLNGVTNAAESPLPNLNGKKSGVVEADKRAQARKDYVNFWEDALKKRDDARKDQIKQNISELNGKKSGVVEADKRAQARKDYVNFWEDALKKRDDARKEQIKQNISELKGKKSGVVIADQIAEGNKAKGGKGILKAMKGKKGKAALIAGGAALIAGAVALFRKKDEEPALSEENMANPEHLPQDDSVVNESEQVVPVPVQESQEAQGSQGNEPATEYIVKKGDCVWNIAEKHLIDLHKSEPDYKPTDKEILEHTLEIMKLNNLKYESDGYVVLIHPDDKLKLVA